jgi:hypothetical protein
MRRFADMPLVSISNAQRRPLEALELNWTATVYHGLPLESYARGAGDGGYVAFLGPPPRRAPAARAVLRLSAQPRLRASQYPMVEVPERRQAEVVVRR